MSNQDYVAPFRKELEVFENGSPRGDMMADTAFFLGGMNKRGTRNKRRTMLEEQKWANLWAVRKNPYEFIGDDEMSIGGINLKDINTQLHREGNGDFTVMNVGPFQQALMHDAERGSAYPITDRMQDAGVKMVNPPRVTDLFGDKAVQNRFFDEEPGIVPHWADFANYNHEGGIAQIEQMLEPFQDVPIITKPKGGSQGNGIEFRYPDALVRDLYKEKENRTDLDGAPPEYIAQTALPISGDVRVIAFNDTPVTAEVRYGSDDIDLNNLGQCESGLTQFEIIEKGYADPVDIQELDPGLVRAVEDHYKALEEAYGIDGEESSAFIGWDFLLVDPAEDEHGILERYPQEALNEILQDEYRTEDGAYPIFAEGNTSSGSKIDMINYQNPHQHSALNLLAGADQMSRGRDYQPVREGDLTAEDRQVIEEYITKL